MIEVPPPKPPYAFQPWGGVAVIADHTWAAMRGRAALDVTWEPGPNGSYDSAQYRDVLAKAVAVPGTVARKVGDPEAALKSAARVVEAEYHVPHLPHVPMEPPVAVAHVSGNRCEVWAPTQNPQAAQTEVARVLGMPPDNVRVHVTFLGGGFGRKSKADFCSEAALLSRRVGAPVRVQFTREDDVRHDYVNAVSTNRLTAGLDANGRVVAWRHRTAFPSISSVFGGPAKPGNDDLQQGVLDLAFAVPNLSAEICDARRIRASAGCDRSTTSFRGSRLARSWTRSRRQRRQIPATSGSSSLARPARCRCLTWESRSCPTMGSRSTSIPSMRGVCVM